jgi:hypothetical protein
MKFFGKGGIGKLMRSFGGGGFPGTGRGPGMGRG